MFRSKGNNYAAGGQGISKNNVKTVETEKYLIQCEGFSNPDSINGEVVIKDKSTNKIIYQGMFLNSEKSGYGIEYEIEVKDGKDSKIQIRVAYEGQFRNNKRQGWGKTKEYEGQFRQNQFDGWGKFATNETFYQGYFSNGVYNGPGIHLKGNFQPKQIQALRKENRIEQFLQKQNTQVGLQLFKKFNIEEIYIGQFSKGLKNGSGKLWKQNGYWYAGQFAYNSIHGCGARQRQKGQGVEKGIFHKEDFKGNFQEK